MNKKMKVLLEFLEYHKNNNIELVYHGIDWNASVNVRFCEYNEFSNKLNVVLEHSFDTFMLHITPNMVDFSESMHIWKDECGILDYVEFVKDEEDSRNDKLIHHLIASETTRLLKERGLLRLTTYEKEK